MGPRRARPRAVAPAGARRKPAASRGRALVPGGELLVGRNALFFGRRRRPKQLVVLLHGLNDSAACCAKGVVCRWAKGLPGALLAVPQSPHRTDWSTDGDPGYTWTPTRGLFLFEAQARFGADSHEFRASVQEFHRSVRSSCRELNRWLDAVLDKHGLSNDDLVLAGFSQGSILAAIVGARRGARGVIVCGGVPFAGFFELGGLMPKKSRSRFCVVNGTRDEVVERRPLEEMLAPYDCEWHWSKGVGHDFPSKWYALELTWMKRLFGTAD
ncbi:unnamed protein product [Prorocentrum cordatum]|uniref:Phospholipase/carboxylesterase/thioesterase domain-containing protein n=1 Tax=Prorocentrum cordatum TaxID=2364126 RepID=A0ABN9U334_9DINO|nr:unnamed protein product [Polarella glacialis]